MSIGFSWTASSHFSFDDEPSSMPNAEDVDQRCAFRFIAGLFFFYVSLLP